MLFQLKLNEQKSKASQQNFSSIEKFKSMLSKVKFVAKNVIYVKRWSDNEKESKRSEAHLKPLSSFSRSFEINIGSYSIKIINDSNPLMKNAKELRQKSFFKDYNEGQFDADEFDKHCDHLVVIDRSISNKFVVGTYRLLLKPKFYKNQKFYSQSEFNISSLIRKEPLTLLEAGRSCVHEDYRDGRIIKLLWRGLATYIINNKVDLIFGCASFPSCDYKLFENQLSYLYHYHRTPKRLPTYPHKNLRANFNIINKNLLNIDEEFRKLPPLIKAYLRVGSWVGPGAIIDKKFNTTDVLIVLEAKKIIKKYAQLSFQKGH